MFICFECKLVFDYIIGLWFTSQNRGLMLVVQEVLYVYAQCSQRIGGVE